MNVERFEIDPERAEGFRESFEEIDAAGFDYIDVPGRGEFLEYEDAEWETIALFENSNDPFAWAELFENLNDEFPDELRVVRRDNEFRLEGYAQ